MNIELTLMSESDVVEFKKNIQYEFQKGFEDVFGKCEETILPEKDIDESLNGEGAVAYKAVLDGNFLMKNTLCQILQMILLGMEMKECLHFRK